MSQITKFVMLFGLLNHLSFTTQVSIIKPRTLSSTKLKRLAESTNLDEFSSLLSPILKSRVPGSKGHHLVKQYLIKFFTELGWQVTLDEFDQDTVIGPKRFTNIIATANPDARKYVLLTAHYDSKIIMSSNKNEEFLAAVDSAVPCAMIMSVAKNLDLNELKKNKDYSVKVLFFDGEEAFLNWNENDSIYGSSHLAKHWSEPDESQNVPLAGIEFLILLDLIGEKNPRFYSGFPETHRWFERLHHIEKRLRKQGLISVNNEYFIGGLLSQPLGIEDDHVPFLRKGVPVLHVIPYPFPDCWHKMCDNGQNVDKETVHDLLKIFRIFFMELMRA